jgi:hypothetical protein
MPPLESRDHRITAREAAAHTKRHRATLGKHHAEGDHGGAFMGDQVLELLAQKNCVALRVYHGRNAKGARSIVLVGVDSLNRDMTEGTCLEICWPCPPYCDPDTILRKD